MGADVKICISMHIQFYTVSACQQESMIVQQKRSIKRSMMHSAMAGECDSATQAGARLLYEVGW